MKTRKTPTNQRETYTYEFSSETGRQKVTIQAADGMSGWIKKLHALDDSEVYYENKYIGVQSKEERKAWDAYGRDHYTTAGNRGLASVDYGFERGYRQDYLNVVRQTAYEMPVQSDREYRLHELIEQLPARQRQVIVLVGLEGCSETEAASLLGIGKSTVSEHYKKAQQFIRENFYRPGQTAVSL